MHIARSTFFLTLSLALFAQNPAAPPAAHMKMSASDLSIQIQGVAASAAIAIVQIQTVGFSDGSGEESGPSVPAAERGVGSGVIIDPTGYILTNAHVVAGARRVTVLLSPTATRTLGKQPPYTQEDRQLPATIVGVDHDTDLAVIKVDGATLPTLQFVDARQARPGEFVLAIGSPLGLESSVSFGVISATQRYIRPDDPTPFLQTDTPINPGNSGGPLIDLDGRVLGINTLILSQSGGSEGVGFAIPASIAKHIYQQLRKNGRVRRGQIGIFSQALNPALAEALGLSTKHGILITDVGERTAADAAGLRPNDVIIEADGVPVRDMQRFQALLFNQPVNEQIKLAIVRGTERLTLQVGLVERLTDPTRLADLLANEAVDCPKLGILALPLYGKASQLFPMSRRSQGVIVASLVPENPLMTQSLKAGDIIYAINNQSIGSIDELNSRITDLPAGKPAFAFIERQGRTIYVPLERR